MAVCVGRGAIACVDKLSRLWSAKSGHAFPPRRRTLETTVTDETDPARTGKGSDACACVENRFLLTERSPRGSCSVANAYGSPLAGGQGFPALAGVPGQLFLAAPSLRP